MSDPDTTDSPLEAAAGGDATRATEAFSALGNETRLAILLALWEAYDPGRPDEGVPFSALREHVGVRDSGRFNYHLDRLEGRFVRRVEDSDSGDSSDGRSAGGYALRRSGQAVVRTVLAGTAIEEPSFERSEIDIACPLCGAPTAVTYQDGWVYRVCTECEGAYEGHDLGPDGYLTGGALDPAGLTDRSPEEAWAAALTRAYQDTKTAVEGICNECSGPVDRTLLVCEDHDHDPDGVCESCGRRFAAMALLSCRVCKNHHAASPSTLVVHHPAVVAFYYERGVALQYEVDDVERVRRRSEFVAEHEQEVVSTDPPRVEVTVRYEGDECRLTLDETLSVIETSEKQ
jgi:DNA-binding transcriptional ArsR family regulator